MGITNVSLERQMAQCNQQAGFYTCAVRAVRAECDSAPVPQILETVLPHAAAGVEHETTGTSYAKQLRVPAELKEARSQSRAALNAQQRKNARATERKLAARWRGDRKLAELKAKGPLRRCNHTIVTKEGPTISRQA